MNYFDLYTIKARVAPALVTVAPALALIIAILDLQSFDASQIWATLGLLVILLALSNVSREAGLRVQRRIYRHNDGRPTFDPLSYGDLTFNDETKLRYLAFLSSKIRRPYPTMEQAASDPAMARRFYNDAAAWLREATRDTSKFRILFDENMTYGYFRNLLGLKWLAVAINLSVSFFCALVILEHTLLFKETADRLPYVFAVSVIHLLYVLFGVTEARMRNAGKRYARQLLLSCEALESEA